MRIENTASAALSNLGRAAAESSSRIARSSQDPQMDQVDLGRELVTLNGIQQAYKANVVVLRTGAELTGAIIDMYA